MGELSTGLFGVITVPEIGDITEFAGAWVTGVKVRTGATGATGAIVVGKLLTGATELLPGELTLLN